ncbi:unnamed protein product [Rhodiola kirilowii]
MAASSIVPRVHARSVSLPSRAHLLASQFDVCLEKLNASEVTCSSYAMISDKLHGIIDLHECVDQLLKLQSTQQIVLSECHKEWVDKVMDGSLRLLDVCGIAKDVLLQTKECVQAFQSVLRRKRGHRAEFVAEVSKYVTSRRHVKKIIQRYLKNLTNQNDSEKDAGNITVAKMFFEAEQATLKVFESLLSFISGSSGPPKGTKWFFVSKLIMPSKPAFGMVDAGEVSDFATVDAAFHNYTACEFTYNNAQSLQYKLADLELNIQDLEEAIERIFRHQIKTRVSLLNILSR